MTGVPADSLPEGLVRVLRRPRPTPVPGERCELCEELLDEGHPHVVDLSSRSLMCCCRACGLLFTEPGAARGRYRTVPDRWLHDPALTLTPEDWARFQIPVRLAFFFVNSVLDRVVALYPGPGGATESELALDAWDDLLAGSALARELTPDVEALLVDGDGPSCHLVPVDACYELVGRLRTCWVGFEGGQEARDELQRFMARVDERSRAVPARTG